MHNLHHLFAVTLWGLTWASSASAQPSTGPCQTSKDLPPGFLTVNARGAARVYWGKELLGEVPLARHKLPAGCVELRLESIDSNEVQLFRATVESGRVVTLAAPFPKDAVALTLVPEFVRSEVNEGLCKLNPDVQRAAMELQSLAFDHAAKTLARAIDRPDNCREDLINIYATKAIADAALGELERCEGDFLSVLALDPKFSMARTFPKIERCLEAARAVPEAQRTLSMSANSASYDRSRSVYTVTVKLVDPLGLVSSFEIFARPRGATDYWRLSAPRVGDQASLEIPEFAGRPGASPGLEYVVAATDRWGGRLLISGTRTKPLTASP